MKRLKKMMALIIAVAMVMAMALPVFAATQNVPATTADTDNATITINNPSKGETYSAFKLFDATTTSGGKFPFFYIFKVNLHEQLLPLWRRRDGERRLEAALETWVNGKTATASGESNGSEALAFTGLPYGYYVITTSHVDDDKKPKGIITVDSTNPTASVYDKNVNVPTAEKNC